VWGRRENVVVVARSRGKGNDIRVTYLRNHAHVEESRVLLRMVRGNDLGKGWECFGVERDKGI
jgi:hypothetical protein